MTHEIEPVEHRVSGDTLHLPFAVPNNDDEGEEWLDLAGAEIQWAIFNSNDVMELSENDDGVSITVISPTSEGKFRVEIEKETVRDLNGVYEEWIRIYSAGGQRQTWISSISFRKDRMQS